MKATTALRKIAALRKRIKGIQGGQGAGKTYGILQLLINHASSQPNREIIIASHELTKMRLTVIKDFVNIMTIFEIYSPDNFKGGTFYRFPNNSFIKFIGLDKEDVGKGLRSHVVFLNEANKIPFEAARQLISRAGKVYIDFNPDCRFWYHSELMEDEDTDHLELTWRDNECLPTPERNEIQSYYKRGYNDDGTVKNKYWANKARVYGDGLVGQVDGAIFENWETFSEYPDEEYIRLFGADWGSVDPTTLIECRFYKGSRIYIKEHFGKPCENDADFQQFKDTLRRVMVERDICIADCAGKDKILELQMEKYRVIKSDKSALTSAGSIVDGIDILQQYNIFLYHEDSLLIDEFQNYAWAKDKYTGQAIPVPIDKYNHRIDPLRYTVRAYHLQGYKQRVNK